MEYTYLVKTGRISVNRTTELNKMVEYLCNKYNLPPSSVVKYCIARVYNKEMMDEKREIDYLDGGKIQ